MTTPLVQKLRYMGRQYAAGQVARGGVAGKHYLEEAADEIERLTAALAAPLPQPPEALIDLEAISWAYRKLGAFGVLNNNQDNALMADRLNLMLLRADCLPHA